MDGWDDRSRGEKDCGSKICWTEDWLKERGEPTLLKKATFSIFTRR